MHLRSSFPAAEVEAAAARVRDAPDFGPWAQRYFAKYFTVAPSSFHLWFDDELGKFHRTRNQRLNVLAPRGSAKTTRLLAYVVYCVCHKIEPYIVLTSDTSDQAEKYLDTIKTELEENDLLIQDYPRVAGKGGVWRSDAIETRNGIRIEALSTGRKIRGRKHRQYRPSLIVVDDPQNLDHIVSELQRGRSMSWLKHDVCNAGDPGTNILVAGTALHEDCIVCQLQKLWPSRLFRSIEQWPDRMDLWREWELRYLDLDDRDREATAREYYERHRAEMDAGAVVMWPARMNLYALMLKRIEIGPAAFNFEYQNHPVNPAVQEWPETYFDRPDMWFDVWPALETLTVRALALDPSKGRKDKKSDYSAFVRLGRAADGRIYVEADMARRDTAAIVSDAVRHCEEFRPDVFALETNSWQDLLQAPIEQEAVNRGVPLPIRPVVNTVHKAVRIRRLTPDLHQGRFRFRRNPATQLLVQQMRDFPAGAHDDGPDALEMARRAAVEFFNASVT